MFLSPTTHIRYLLLWKKLSQNVTASNNTYFCSHSVYGSGIWAQLGWFRAHGLTACSHGASMSGGLSQGWMEWGSASKLTRSSAGFRSPGAEGPQPPEAHWLLAGGHSQFLALWAFQHGSLLSRSGQADKTTASAHKAKSHSFVT